MLSKTRLKFIRSFRLTKFRITEGIFIIEGDKLLSEALNPSSNPNFKIHSIYALQSWIDKNKELIAPFGVLVNSISEKELNQISQLKTPNQVLALVHGYGEDNKKIDSHNKLLIALDNIQDPGNLGTIIRLADWFGIKDILLSHGCADPFSPKVVQATMGSIFRIALHQIHLDSWLNDLPQEFPVYGAVLDGENLYKTKLNNKGVLLMGNESKGIQAELKKTISHPLTIPRGNLADSGPESLNVSMALGIILSEFNRQIS